MLPSVGDVVAVRVTPGHDMGVILRVLPRRTSFERWRGKNRGERQVLAANVDVIFIVQPLGAERDTLPLMRDRVARSLVLARDCGPTPSWCSPRSTVASPPKWPTCATPSVA